MRFGARLDLEKLLTDKVKIQRDFGILCERLQEEKYTVSDLGLKPRWVVHWEEKGLFLKDTPKGKWHSFNLVEALWVKILLKLRTFNLPLDSIKEVKDNLVVSLGEVNDEVEEIMKDTILKLSQPENILQVKALLASDDYKKMLNETKINLLELFVMDMIIFRNQFRFLINEHGQLLLQKEHYEDIYSEIEEVNQFLNGTYLSVSLNEILNELVIDLGEFEASTALILTPEEAAVIKAIREEEVKSVDIKMKKGIVSAPVQINVEKEMSIDPAVKLTEIITSGGYQDITIKVEDGRVVYCKNIGKRRLK